MGIIQFPGVPSKGESADLAETIHVDMDFNLKEAATIVCVLLSLKPKCSPEKDAEWLKVATGIVNKIRMAVGEPTYLAIINQLRL